MRHTVPLLLSQVACECFTRCFLSRLELTFNVLCVYSYSRVFARHVLQRACIRRRVTVLARIDLPVAGDACLKQPSV